MSLTISILKVYHVADFNLSTTATTTNIDTLNLSINNKNKVKIDCSCKVLVGNKKYLTKVGRVYMNNDELENDTKLKRTQRKRLTSQKSFNHSGQVVFDFYQDHDEISEYKELLHNKSMCKSTLKYYFKSNTKLKNGYKLEIYCFKKTNFLSKPFAKYSMLLDLLDNNPNEFNNQVKIIVDDYLTDPNTNAIIKAKICFQIIYSDYLNENKNKLSNKYQVRHNMLATEQNQSTAFDYIGTLVKTGEFALENFDLNSNFDSESIKKFIMSAGNCSMTLGFALNLIASFELSPSQKFQIKNSLIKNNPFGIDYSELNSHYILNQLFYSDHDEKITSWQVKVNILEIKNLIGINENVYCVVDVGGKQFRTKEKHIDNLKFDENEAFIVRIEDKEFQKAFNYTITISVYFKNFFYADVFVGSFKTDFATIYRHPGHEVYHKWGELIDKNDNKLNIVQIGANSTYESEFILKGFVKFDMFLQSKGDKAKIHYSQNKKEDVDDTDDIESAQILVKSNEASNQSSYFSFFKLSNSQPSYATDLANLNPFIRVTHADTVKTTSAIKSTSEPIWNQSVEFSFFYPPLVNLFKIELCSLAGENQIVLAREYLTIKDISNYSTHHSYYPTFGPSFIEMFDKPNNYRIKKAYRVEKSLVYQDIKHNSIEKSVDENHNSYNNSVHTSTVYESLVADGSFQIARLLFSITSKENSFEAKARKYSMTWNTKKNTNDFIAFVVIDQATMINNRYKNGHVSFKLCCGINGYETNGPNQTEQVYPIQLNSQMPIYLPFEKTKQCVCLKFTTEDMRYVMFKINYLDNNLEAISKTYKEFKEILWQNKSITEPKLKEANFLYDKIKEQTNEIISYLKDIYINNNLFKTKFEEKKAAEIELCCTTIIDLLNIILRLMFKFKNSPSVENFKFYVDLIIRNRIIKIKNYSMEPFCFFPDLSLWLLFNNEPVGICTLKSYDIIWSNDPKCTGKVCSKLVFTDVRSLNQSDFENPESEKIARIRILAWLGLEMDKNEILASLPKSYECLQDSKNEFDLPRKLFTLEPHIFKLNAYLYQGRDMLLLDIAGESDPFAVISILNQSVKSKTIDNTANPTWNEALCIPEIYLYGKLDEILSSPPEIIVDLYDEDPFSQRDFMGSCYVTPNINTGLNMAPKLKWFRLFYNYGSAGDILASFELVYLNGRDSKTSSQNQLDIKIPKEILPKTRPYTLEICYWGLRNIREQNFLMVGGWNQQKITLQIEIGDRKLDSNIIDTPSFNPNFVQIHQKHVIDLAEEDEYKPHLNIKCECYGSLFLYTKIHNQLESLEKTFSKKILIGSCTIKSIGDYCYDNFKLETFCVKNSSRNLWSFNSTIEDNPNYEKEESTVNKKTSNKAAKAPKIIETNTADLDLDYLDWWSKYFRSINKNKDNSENSSDTSSSSSSDDEEEEEENNSSSDEGFSISKKFKSKKKESINKFLKKTSNLKENGKPESTRKKRKKIQEIKIYDNELEKNHKLNEVIETYNLIVGKNFIFTKNDVQCQFKGKFMLYDRSRLSPSLNNYLNLNNGFLKKMPTNMPVKAKVHVYIIKASMISSHNLIGKFDPSIYLECGDIELNEKLKLTSNEDLIGKCFEFEARFPNQSQLVVSIKNWNILNGSDLIGKTTIDLEDRFYSNCYATCGLPKKYEIEGYNEWRDNLKPKQILDKLCKKFGLQKPKFANGKLAITQINGRIFEFPESLTDDNLFIKGSESEIFKSDTDSATNKDQNLNLSHYEEQLALDALNNWNKICNVELVPEHVETRSLYNPELGDLEQAKLQMWIDIFPINEYKIHRIATPVDIQLRKPKKFQLRVVIFNCKDVILDDTNLITGEKTSDIYVKSYLCDLKNDYQKTDVHYRSLNGEGNFNWRFVFNFDYLPYENRIVYNQRENFSFNSKIRRFKPVVKLQCYDEDHLSSDDLLGEIELNLSRFIKGASSADKCSLNMDKSKWPKVNLFKKRVHRGWWPFFSKKDNAKVITGKVEAEFRLLTDKEAEEQPAGLGREPPDALPPPNRPETSFLWFQRPYQTFRFLIWKNYWRQIILIGILLIVIIALIIFFVQLPSAFINKLVG